jgi:hypothetical protein
VRRLDDGSLHGDLEISILVFLLIDVNWLCASSIIHSPISVVVDGIVIFLFDS